MTCLTCASFVQGSCEVYPRLILPWPVHPVTPQVPSPRQYPDDWCFQWRAK